MRFSKISQRYAIVIILALVLFHSACNWYILEHHKTPSGSGSNAISYLIRSREIYSHLIERRFPFDVDVTYQKYSPLFCYLTQPFYFLLGRSNTSALLVNDLFWALLLFSVFFLGKELFSEEAGLLAVVLISFYPQVYGLSRVYLLDFALTAVICLDFYLLVKSEGFSDRRFSLLLGISLGISALLKLAFIVFLIAPIFLYLLFDAHLHLQRERMHKRFAHFLLTVLISLGLYSLWFLKNPTFILNDAYSALTFVWVAPPKTFLDNALYWPKFIFTTQLLYLFGFLVVVAAIHLIISKRYEPRGKVALLTYLIIPLLFFTFVVRFTKNPRYVLPLTLGFALVSSAFLVNLQQKSLKRVIITLCIALGVLQFFILNFFPHVNCSANPAAEFYFSSYRGHPPLPLSEGTRGIYQPSANDLGLEGLFDILLDDISGVREQNKTYLVFVSSPFISFNLQEGIDMRKPEERRRFSQFKICCGASSNEAPLLDAGPDYYVLVNTSEPHDWWSTAPGRAELQKHAGDYSLLDRMNISLVTEGCPLAEGELFRHIELEIYKKVKAGVNSE